MLIENNVAYISHEIILIKPIFNPKIIKVKSQTILFQKVFFTALNTRLSQLSISEIS